MVRSLVAAFIISAALTGVAFGATPSLDAAAFRSLGPAVSGGRLGAVAGTDADPRLYYVGAAGGGVWKSTNGGQSWRPVFDKQPVASIGAIAIDPKNVDVVWVGTGEADPRNDVTQGDGIYRSADGGTSWTRVLALHDALISAISIDPRDPKDVAVAVLGDPFADDVDRGIYRTTDGGGTWKKTLYVGPSSGASDLVRSSANPDTLFAGVWQFRRTGWSLQSGGPDDGLYRSDDDGATWTRLTGKGLPTDTLGRIGLAAGVSDPRRIYAVIQSKQGLLWRSDDGGASWTARSRDTLIDERPFYFNRVFVDPADADRVWSVSVHLTVSTDGGATFATTGRELHGDHHAMWIAADGRRIIEGNDGGVGLSNDGGASWLWRKTIPISQAYHVGSSRGTSYSVCVPLQDNGTFCAPADPHGGGINSADWRRAGGGDGTWALFDPLDANLVWESFGGGNFAGDLYVHDLRTGETRSVAPYSRDQNVIDPRALRYRFNWETPIAFDPFDGHTAYVGANVLFATRDRGYHYRVVSPDLTRDERAHQVVTGGITLDGTGAETSDTILTIAPSPTTRGEIWIGTDDGVIQRTRDAGRHWRDVTPPFARSHPWGRFGSISPSSLVPGTAFAIYDRHMVGDRAPYVFATTDDGAHWTRIDAGLPDGIEARSVLADPRDRDVVYAGTETGLYASWDRGTHWRALTAGLPPASVRDVRIQEDANDLLVATHGRGLYVLDDATPLQRLADARARGTRLFPIRAATLWQTDAPFGTPRDGAGAPYGAIVTFYQNAASATLPTAVVVDATGRVVRRFATHDEGGKRVSDTGNAAGLNRFVWDLTEDPPVPWRAAPSWNRGYDDGAPVVPGRYAVRVTFGGKTYSQPVVVRPDPRTRYSVAQALALHAATRASFADIGRVDDALNALSTIAAEAPLRSAALAKRGDAAGAASVAAVGTRAGELIASMSSNAANDQDDDFLPDVLRERLQTQVDTYLGSFAPPTAEQMRESAVLHALTDDRIARYRAFARGDLSRADAVLAKAGLPSLATPSHR
jgi:hypothetical protein